MRTPRTPAHDRGFTLVELLTVVAIIAVLAGLMLTALSAVRKKARDTTTMTTMRAFANACEAFHQEHGFYPGVVPENILANDPRISSMENALFHLMGGYARQLDNDGTYGAYGGTEIIFSSPDGSSFPVKFNSVALGDGPIINGRPYAPYFTPGDEELREAIGQASVEVDLPDLVDAWGQPIIYLRRQRPTGELVSTNIPQFGQFASTTLGAYTAASTLGELGRSQVENTILPNGSPDPTRDANLARVLGHPSLANQSRGGFMVLSAGKDGIYLSRTDGPGTEDAPVDDLTPSGTPYPSTIFDEYDDLLTFGGT